MSENCPESCSKQTLLNNLRDKSRAATVVQEVTGYEMSSSVGVSYDPDAPFKATDSTLTRANVYGYRGEYVKLDSEDLSRINEKIVERVQKVIDLKNELEECEGPQVVELENGTKAMVCGAEITRLAVETASPVEA